MSACTLDSWLMTRTDRYKLNESNRNNEKGSTGVQNAVTLGESTRRAKQAFADRGDWLRGGRTETRSHGPTHLLLFGCRSPRLRSRFRLLRTKQRRPLHGIGHYKVDKHFHCITWFVEENIMRRSLKHLSPPAYSILQKWEKSFSFCSAEFSENKRRTKINISFSLDSFWLWSLCSVSGTDWLACLWNWNRSKLRSNPCSNCLTIKCFISNRTNINEIFFLSAHLYQSYQKVSSSFFFLLNKSQMTN